MGKIKSIFEYINTEWNCQIWHLFTIKHDNNGHLLNSRHIFVSQSASTPWVTKMLTPKI